MRLVIEDEAGTRTVVPFSADEITLGRAASGVSWRLPDRNVSRRHARFVRSSGAVFVEDLGSLTGTRLNGERIAGRRRVRTGDLVEIGDFDLVVVPDQGEGAGDGLPPPLPAARAEEASPPPAAAAVQPPRAPGRRLALVGAVALLGGLLAGLALARLAR